MSERLESNAIRNGTISSLMLLATIYFGSGRLKDYDPALIAYTFSSVFALFGLAYRYTVWLEKPPTALYWRRGWSLFLRPSRLPGNVLKLIKMFCESFVLQLFIEKRSHLRWAAHFLISWGCIFAFAVTFPLVFGWVHFDADPTLPNYYIMVVLGRYAGRFPAYSLIGWATFHILDFCAISIIIGMVLAFKRRMYDRGAMTLQSFSMDFLPLILLFCVSVTGLMLTVSSLWMKGDSYSFLAIMHAFSVIVLLLYLPFGKFFHIFQRIANIGVYFYKEEGAITDQAKCKGCGEIYAALMQVEDLKTALRQVGMNYTFQDGSHYQDICPTCRRKALALNQLEALGENSFL